MSGPVFSFSPLVMQMNDEAGPLSRSSAEPTRPVFCPLCASLLSALQARAQPQALGNWKAWCSLDVMQVHRPVRPLLKPQCVVPFRDAALASPGVPVKAMVADVLGPGLGLTF